MVQRRPPPQEVVLQAYRTCQLFEAIELYPGAPPGAVIEARASFGIATLFLPKDERHITWFRHKFAKIETSGYVSNNFFPCASPLPNPLISPLNIK